MYRLFLLLSVMITSSCAVPKAQKSDQRAEIPAPQISCPEGGNCSFEVFERSRLDLQRNREGKIDPQIKEGNQLVVKYHYEKKPGADALDSGYDEYLYLEIDPGQDQIILRDKELQQVKMTFGRICYCKGAMGYFPVLQGQLFVFNKKGNLQIRSNFNVQKVPQITEHIDENINY